MSPKKTGFFVDVDEFSKYLPVISPRSTHATINPPTSGGLQRLASTASAASAAGSIWGQGQGAVALGALQLVGVQQASAALGAKNRGSKAMLSH